MIVPLCFLTNMIYFLPLDLLCILLLVYFCCLCSYLLITIAVLTNLNFRVGIETVLTNDTLEALLLMNMISFSLAVLACCHKRNIPNFSNQTKLIIYSVHSFFLVTLSLLLVSSGVEKNPGPTSQFYSLFSNLERNIVLAHLNIQDLLTRKGTKLDEIALLLDKSSRTPLVLGLSETWLLKHNDTALVTFRNYQQPLRRDRNITAGGKPKKGGGLLVYVSRALTAKRRKDLESEIEAIWVEISGKNTPHILVCNFYRPPQSNKEFFDALETQIGDAKENGLPIFLLGDMNIDLLNTSNPHLYEVNNLKRLFDLVQLIGAPTRIITSSSTLIDHIYSSNPDIVIEAKSHPCPISDHNIVYCRIRTTINRFNKPTSTRLCRIYRKISDENLIIFFSNVNWHGFYSQKDVNQKWIWFHSLLLHARDSLAPKVMVRIQQHKNINQWETEDVKRLRRQCNLALIKWKRTRRLEDETAFFTIREEFQSKQVEDKSLFYRNKCAAIHNPRKRWQTINNLLGRSSKTINCETLTYNGKTTSQAPEIASTLNTFFTEVGKINKSRKKISLPEILNCCDPNGFCFQTVSPQKVLKLLKTLDISKPAGPDELSPELLRKVAIFIYQPLTHLFNYCIAENALPEMWKLANVTPVFKKGDATNPSNYRPISVTSAISKVFEKIISTQLADYLEINNLLSCNQFGYRKQRSTEDAIVKLVEDSKNALNQKRHVAVIFLDLSKAFDTVQHDILLHHLGKLKISSHSVSLVSNYLSNRKQRVKLDNGYSGWLPTTSGVPQGSLLGPLLFLVYANEIDENIINSKVISYADDTALYFSSETKNDLIRNINTDLNVLTNNLKKLELKVNVNKTKLLLISKGKTGDFPEVKIKNEILKPVQEADYLGVTIDKNLKFKSQIQKVINRMSTANFSILHISKFLNKATKALLCNSLVNSQLYCSTVWQYCSDKALLKKFLRQRDWSLRIIESRHFRQNVDDLKTCKKYVPFEVLLDVNTVKFIHKQFSNNFLSCTFKPAPRHKDSFGIQLQNCRINSYRSSLQHRGVMIWNSLDPPIRQTENSKTFKMKAREFLWQQYTSRVGDTWTV